MTTIVTGWTGRKYDALGKQFLATFIEFWPPDIRAIAYLDEPNVLSSLSDDRTTVRSITECEALHEFHDRQRTNPAAHGRERNSNWKERAIREGYSWQHDAAKWAVQAAIPEAAARLIPDGEIMVWFDADVLTFRKVRDGFIEGLIGDADLVHLGREPKHSEIGFWAVRLNDMTRGFLSRFAGLYWSDEVLRLKESHSAFVFDHARRECMARGMKVKDLTPGGRAHVWFQSPLGEVADHLKGNRKSRGRSPERKAA